MSLSSLNEALLRAPFSSMGHISGMTDGAPSTDACGQLHQPQVCKMLQYKDLVVCLEGPNGQMEALQFTFKELPLWDAAAPGKPGPQTTANGSGPQWHAAWGCNNHHSDFTLYTSPTSPSSRHCWAFWWHHCSNQPAPHGHYGAIAAVFPCYPSLCLPAEHAKETATICSFRGSASSQKSEDPFRPEGIDSVTSVQLVTFTPTIPIMTQTSPQAPIPAGALSFTHITPQILQPTLPKTSQMMNFPFITWP